VGITELIEEEVESNPNKVIDRYEVKIRELIDDYLTEEYEEGYWDKAIPQDIKETVNKKIEQEVKTKPIEKKNLILQRRNSNAVIIMDYSKFILKNWNLFEEVFGLKRNWIHTSKA
jgi:hypothetical protein